jgi:hypothetical protein
LQQWQRKQTPCWQKEKEKTQHQTRLTKSRHLPVVCQQESLKKRHPSLGRHHQAWRRHFRRPNKRLHEGFRGSSHPMGSLEVEWREPRQGQMVGSHVLTTTQLLPLLHLPLASA